jgi:hypothetical protein
MKKFLTLVAAMALVATTAMADVKAGQKAYLKTFKASFGMDGTKFAAGHTVDEWEALFADGAKGFIKEYSENIPKRRPFFPTDTAAKLEILEILPKSTKWQ